MYEKVHTTPLLMQFYRMGLHGVKRHIPILARPSDNGTYANEHNVI